MENKIVKVQKRDGTIVDFDQNRISDAIFKALTATGQGDGNRAKKLSIRVVQILNRRFKKEEIPHVEQIQDIVEEVLILEGLVETAKAYILYREQRRRIREATKFAEEAVDRIDQYLEKTDWEVQENANMAFSLQGLNRFGVSYIVKKYWLNKIYPKEIREANEDCDLHIHNLDTLGPYCAGWDLYDFLLKGFGGVPGKMESKPPKHFEAALGQVVNFIFTVSGEVAGAVAFSNFDTLLAPFIRYDNLNYKNVKQALQEFLFNMATPTRVGFQCVSGDTEILTLEGWKGYDEIKEGDIIKTFNLQTKKIENKKTTFIFKRDYQGIMYHLKGKAQDQLISPEHRVVRKTQSNSYQIQPIEEILKLNPSVSIPFISQKDQVGIENFPVKDIKKIDYKGTIWCPHTENGTIIARRKGKVFITGNCPFSNLTLDLKPSPVFAKLPVIIGGKPQKETYGEFEEEMKILDKAFYEAMLEGDKHGRTFSFPIPTINITKDFPWSEPAFDGIWQASAKYGINYFANYIQSSMKPEDVTAMCPLGGNEKVLIKSSRNWGLEYSGIRWIYEGHSKQKSYWIYSDGKFVEGKFNKFESQEMIRVTLVNNHSIAMSKEHLNFVTENERSKIKVLKGKELKPGMYLPYSLKSYKGQGGNRDLGYFVGAYAGDGSLSLETSVIFSLNKEKKTAIIKRLQQIAEKYFGAYSTIIHNSNPQLLTLKVHSKAAVGLCKDFVAGKKREKYYTPRLFGMSEEFHRGVIEGHYATDGGNSNRIYTSSPQMVETLNMLAATLGTTTSIYRDNREGRLGEEANFAVLFYQLNRKRLKDIWFKKNKKLWVKIKSIEKIPNTTAYCFEVKNDEPVFTIGTTGVLTHNCRLLIDKRQLYNRGGGGLFGAGANTGSLGVVTINMPRIGYLSKTKKEFFERLGKMMDLAKESLEIKRKVLESFIEKSLYPYSKFYLSGVKKMRGQYYGNHFSTIGPNGMNEALLNFMGETTASKRGRKFTLEVLDFMRERLVKYQKETDNIYNLEAVPAESTAYRFALRDKEKYPDIITAGTKETPYYTNSTHLPVNFTDDVFEALKLQDELQCKYSGGTVLHLFLGERISDIQTVKNLIKKIFENFKLPYVTLTPTFSICPSHGYLEGEHFECPKCTIKQPCEVYSRIVGYLRPVRQWNLGKKEEFKWRKEYRTYQDEKIIPLPKEKIPSQIKI